MRWRVTGLGIFAGAMLVPAALSAATENKVTTHEESFPIGFEADSAALYHRQRAAIHDLVVKARQAGVTSIRLEVPASAVAKPGHTAASGTQESRFHAIEDTLAEFGLDRYQVQSGNGFRLVVTGLPGSAEPPVPETAPDSGASRAASATAGGAPTAMVPPPPAVEVSSSPTSLLPTVAQIQAPTTPVGSPAPGAASPAVAPPTSPSTMPVQLTAAQVPESTNPPASTAPVSPTAPVPLTPQSPAVGAPPAVAEPPAAVAAPPAPAQPPVPLAAPQAAVTPTPAAPVAPEPEAPHHPQGSQPSQSSQPSQGSQPAHQPRAESVSSEPDDTVAEEEDVPEWKKIHEWTADTGELYSEVIERWAREAGIPESVSVNGVDDCPVKHPLKFRTDLKTAVIRFTKSFATADPAPLVDFWDDGTNFAIELTVGQSL